MSEVLPYFRGATRKIRTVSLSLLVRKSLTFCALKCTRMYRLKGCHIKAITFTEFRKHASSLFSAVENGEIIVILRHGKPIAEITPVSPEATAPSWKNPGLRLSVKGARLSSAILEERREHVL
jgi:antitoxin (DNA-binding transcriptional repressor) of toxin-antitoxin stability system